MLRMRWQVRSIDVELRRWPHSGPLLWFVVFIVLLETRTAGAVLETSELFEEHVPLSPETAGQAQAGSSLLETVAGQHSASRSQRSLRISSTREEVWHFAGFGADVSASDAALAAVIAAAERPAGQFSIGQRLESERMGFMEGVAHPASAIAVISLLGVMIVLIVWACCMRVGCLPGLGGHAGNVRKERERQRAVLGLGQRGEQPPVTAAATQPSGPGQLAGDELNELFKRATDPDNPVLQASFDTLSNTDKLKTYGLYRQGMDGDVSGDRPSVFDIVERAKYDAWAELAGTTKDLARRQFIVKADEMAPGWRNWQPSLDIDEPPGQEPAAEEDGAAERQRRPPTPPG
eukprot:TRINITY_DN8202_c0_g2_i1.p1 TRINITY_DN8202_c0_g2~~TRINITY_DN8202_c0_g2_i1.p1  ORF type:complete len:348 (-),score=87.58 TRINITY_DN8202_c0_g2_i1:85-1128(-)